MSSEARSRAPGMTGPGALGGTCVLNADKNRKGVRSVIVVTPSFRIKGVATTSTISVGRPHLWLCT